MVNELQEKMYGYRSFNEAYLKQSKITNGKSTIITSRCQHTTSQPKKRKMVPRSSYHMKHKMYHNKQKQLTFKI